MDEAKFWKLMDEARAESRGDIDEQLSILTNKLEQLPISEIVEYQRIVDSLMDQSYTWDLWAAGYLLNGGCSDDCFDYFRGWLIVQGKEVYYNALRDPESLADLTLSENGVECETLLTIAWTAYENKTGQEFPLLTKLTSRDEPAGEEWEEDDVDNKYPKLAAISRNWSPN